MKTQGNANLVRTYRRAASAVQSAPYPITSGRSVRLEGVLSMERSKEREEAMCSFISYCVHGARKKRECEKDALICVWCGGYCCGLLLIGSALRVFSSVCQFVPSALTMWPIRVQRGDAIKGHWTQDWKNARHFNCREAVWSGTLMFCLFRRGGLQQETETGECS